VLGRPPDCLRASVVVFSSCGQSNSRSFYSRTHPAFSA
jgi:hypothetical protein